MKIVLLLLAAAVVAEAAVTYSIYGQNNHRVQKRPSGTTQKRVTKVQQPQAPSYAQQLVGQLVKGLTNTGTKALDGYVMSKIDNHVQNANFENAMRQQQLYYQRMAQFMANSQQFNNQMQAQGINPMMNPMMGQMPMNPYMYYYAPPQANPQQTNVNPSPAEED